MCSVYSVYLMGFDVVCDDDTVSPIWFLSEDQKTESIIRKISFVLNILSELGGILGKDSAIGEGDRFAGLIERNVNILAIEKVNVMTSIIAKIELWSCFGVGGSVLVLVNLILPNMGERVLPVRNSVIIRRDPKSNMIEQIVKGFVKGILKNELFGVNGGIVRRRRERHILGGGRKVGSRHYN